MEIFSEAVIGTSGLAFVIVNLVLFGGAAAITGQALANSWKPLAHVLGYCLLLTFGARFILYGLFGAELFSGLGALITAVVLMAIGSFSFRLNRARKMVAQYPWVYQRTGLLGWGPLHPEKGEP